MAWIRYAQSESILAFLTKQTDAAMLLLQYSNLLRQIAELVNALVKKVEIFQHWQYFKIYEMALMRYLRPGKIERLKREVESFIGIILKTIPYWWINKDQLEEEQEVNNKQRLAIIIIIRDEMEVKQLCIAGLKFGGVVKK